MPALDHVQVAAPPGREDDARGFYGALLGLEEFEKPPALRLRGGVWSSVCDQELHVGVEDPFTPATKAHPALRVAGLDALRTRLEDAGDTVVEDDGTIPGVRSFCTTDPFGNRIELLERESTG
jgi:catechol 2,3-dioxygenase-like lactoylglutathione lyase family enzyme